MKKTLKPRIVPFLLSLAFLSLTVWIEPLLSQSSRPGGRAVVLSMDGFAADLLDGGLVDRYMPFLSSFIKSNAVALRSISSFPSNTQTAHAALWTGAYGGVSGITGTHLVETPLAEHSIVDGISGFSSIPLRAEPIFITAARQGVKTVVVTATQSNPTKPFFTEGNFGLTAKDIDEIKKNLSIYDVYAGQLGRQQIIKRADLKEPSAHEMPADLLGKKALAFKRALKFGLTSAMSESPWYRESREGLLSGYWYQPTSSGRYDRVRLVLDIRNPQEARGSKSVKEEWSSVSIDTTATDSGWFTLPFTLFEFQAALVFRLFHAPSKGDDFLLYLADPYAFLGTDQKGLDRLAAELGGIFGNGASWPYRDGELGKILADGGNGVAEERYAESAEELIARFTQLWKIATRNTDWRLACAYIPQPDEALHTWYGWLDPRSPAYRPEFASRLEPYFGRILRALDRYLETIVKDLGSDGMFIFATDHGMRGTTRTFYPNRLLKEHGILAVDKNGKPDLNRTRAYSPSSFTIYVNKDVYQGGIVPPLEVDSVIRQVVVALKSVVDPMSGAPVINRIVTPGTDEAMKWGVGLEGSGDIFFDLAHPYYLSTITNDGPLTQETRPSGAHGFYPAESDMQGLMVVAGKGIVGLESGARVRLIDAAPTVCAWLGIRPPKQATGKNLLQR